MMMNVDERRNALTFCNKKQVIKSKPSVNLYIYKF